MSRQKGSPKTGGRKAGTPNKVTGELKGWLENLINQNREQIETDLSKLAPKERLLILEKLLQYVLPKQKTELEITGVNAKVEDKTEYLEFMPEDKLFELADALQEAEHQYLKAQRGKG